MCGKQCIFHYKYKQRKTINLRFRICTNMNKIVLVSSENRQKQTQRHTTSSSLSVRSAWISQLYRAMWNSSSWDLWARPSICSNYKKTTDFSLEMQITYTDVSCPLFTYVGCSFFVTEHVRVRGHDRRPRLLWNTRGLRSSFALVHQLLHGVCDALITWKSEVQRGGVENVLPKSYNSRWLITT